MAARSHGEWSVDMRPGEVPDAGDPVRAEGEIAGRGRHDAAARQSDPKRGWGDRPAAAQGDSCHAESRGGVLAGGHGDGFRGRGGSGLAENPADRAGGQLTRGRGNTHPYPLRNGTSAHLSATVLWSRDGVYRCFMTRE